MRLTNLAIRMIQSHSPAIISKLARSLGCTVGTINRYIRDNSVYLTAYPTLKVIQEETGLTEEEILGRNISVHNDDEDRRLYDDNPGSFRIVIVYI